MSIFDKRVTYKPFEYPGIYQFTDAINNAFWVHSEVDFTADIQDFHAHLSTAEQLAIKNSLLAIAQIEVAVKSFWGNLYHHFPEWPYQAQKTWIITQDRTLMKSFENIHFWHGSLEGLVSSLALKDSQNCWFLGGGQLITDAVNKNLLDRLEIFIIPALLGTGIPLFSKPRQKTLILEDMKFIGESIAHHIYNFRKE